MSLGSQSESESKSTLRHFITQLSIWQFKVITCLRVITIWTEIAANHTTSISPVENENKYWMENV